MDAAMALVADGGEADLFVVIGRQSLHTIVRAVRHLSYGEIPMTRRPDVDTRCFDLAEDFLSEIKGMTDDDVWALAKDIQTACEDACREVEEREMGKHK
jgi:hypothetical protein